MENVAWPVVFMLLLALWLTHVITCIKLAWWGFLIAGAIFFPVAVVHGAMIWWGALFG